MRLLVSLADIRDGFIIAYGIIGILFFAVGIVVAIVVGFSARALMRSVREILNDSVRPTLGSIRETANSIRGTTEFVGQTAVAPIIRTYGMFAGVRRGLGVISGLTRRRRG